MKERRIRWVAAALIFVFAPALVFGQQPQPMTVCEVLAGWKKLSGKPVTVVGRFHCSWSVIDHTCHLDQDQCAHPVTSKGHVWPNKIVLVDWEKGMPKLPTVKSGEDKSAAREKLSVVRATTVLGSYQVPGFKTEGGTITSSVMVDTKDEWGVALGRLVTRRLPKDDCGDTVECGFFGAPVALIINPGDPETYKDEDLLGSPTGK